MFVDTAEIHVKAGSGGNGFVSFRREKYVPKGGPDGGDGGDGGSVVFVADPNVNTLLDFSGKHHWRAGDGRHGTGKKMAGRSGGDLHVPVPPGTEVYDLGLGLRVDVPDEPDAAGPPPAAGVKIADLVEPGQTVVIARGGRGGLGNWHFRSSTHQAPREATPGEPGEERQLRLELKLIADVGLAGLPNAGKSTLLSAVSAARPKIADYPFTTLEPNLGIAELDAERQLVIADVPGLIEGASQGAGLGHAFLKHIERCRVLIHLLDVMPPDGSDPAANYRTIRAELERFSPDLATKPQVVAVSKIDLLAGDDAPLQRLEQALSDVGPVLPVSSATGQGVRELLEAAWDRVHPSDEADRA